MYRSCSGMAPLSPTRSTSSLRSTTNPGGDRCSRQSSLQPQPHSQRRLVLGEQASFLLDTSLLASCPSHLMAVPEACAPAAHPKGGRPAVLPQLMLARVGQG